MRILHAFSMLPGIGWSPNMAILAESCTFFKFSALQSQIAFVDNMNYWQCSLEELGKEFDLATIPVDFYTCSDEELARHCKRDVEVLVRVWDYWLQFLDHNHLGNFSITLAGQAWNAYRHRFMPCKIGIHNRLDACELERRAYRGGRCDVFQLGEQDDGPYYLVDVNGLYAYCMRSFPVPCSLVNVIVNVTPEYLAQLLTKYCVIADVILDTPEPFYAISQRGYNIYPVGSFSATLTTSELKHALHEGHIKAIGQCAFYEPVNLFSQYVTFFQDLREKYIQSGDKARQLICKQFRNTLYGKFGQHGYRQEICDDAPLDAVSMIRCWDADDDEEFTQITFGGKVIRQYQTPESDDSFPAISAHVAAYARQVLWEYVNIAGQGHVLYSDTDSLIVTQTGFEALQPYLNQTDLGYLKLLGKTDSLEIRAKKNYTFGGNVRRKGIKRDAQQNTDGTFTQTQFTSIRWAFSHQNLDDVITYDATIHESTGLAHGTITRDGRCIPPAWSLDSRQVESIVAPESHHSWTWWFSESWFRSLQPRPWFPRLTEGQERYLRDLEVSELCALDGLSGRSSVF